MSLANDEEILNLIADRLEALEKAIGSEGGQELARARRMAARERRMLREETLSSENVAAGAADQLMKVHEGLAEAQSVFKALVESANSEILTKERSAQASTQLLQTRQADVEAQLAGVTQQLQELTSLVGQVDSNRQRNEQMLGQVEGRLKQMLDDGQFRKELREIASKEAGNADEAFVMAIAQKAIRQALDSGVIPPQLQPKPERPAGTGD
nr:hypothetical protein 20 [bacterium]